MADSTPEHDTWSGVDFNAHKLLIAHQRRDIGSCMCGWGVNTGDLGRSHALHVWRELQRAVLPARDAQIREAIARAIEEEVTVTSWPNSPTSEDGRRAATIARTARVGEEP